MGFYFVCVMRSRSESFLLSSTIWDVTFASLPKPSYTKNVPFGVSVLAVVTNKVEPPYDH